MDFNTLSATLTVSSLSLGESFVYELFFGVRYSNLGYLLKLVFPVLAIASVVVIFQAKTLRVRMLTSSVILAIGAYLLVIPPSDAAIPFGFPFSYVSAKPTTDNFGGSAFDITYSFWIFLLDFAIIFSVLAILVYSASLLSKRLRRSSKPPS